MCLRKCAACRGDAARSAGAAVAVYRFYYLDAADRVAAAEVFHCDNDVDAQARAEKLLTGSIHPGIEVWDRIQVVYRARKPD